jgi:hypothetical protein
VLQKGKQFKLMTKEGILDDHKSVLSSSGISTKDGKISPLFV